MRYTKSLFCEVLLKDDCFDRIKAILSSDQPEFTGGASDDQCDLRASDQNDSA
jgi:hypothetical protein